MTNHIKGRAEVISRREVKFVSAMANMNDNSLHAGARLTLGPCSPYSQCTECDKADDQCPNMLMQGQQCACGRPLTQSDLWRTREDGVLACRYCRPAASYIRDLIAIAQVLAQPVTLESLWLACAWRPEYTEIVTVHLASAGIQVEAPESGRFTPWENIEPH